MSEHPDCAEFLFSDMTVESTRCAAGNSRPLPDSKIERRLPIEGDLLWQGCLRELFLEPILDCREEGGKVWQGTIY